MVSLLLTSFSVEHFFQSLIFFFCMLFINVVDNSLKMLGWENLVDIEGVSGMSKRMEIILHNF